MAKGPGNSIIAPDISQLPNVLVDRLRHYFSTYKLVPGATSVPITAYGKDHAHAVVTAAMQDYHEVYGGPLER